ncbi:peptidoglycan DD-metalloendopeptidase family protein [Winogradskyella psychrotolerans]|uniref:peptidoglycan DD-metalloendopeptidase family protein n=1 Tax=Winogradskyella psychrotolerans TaxID=1344585 RepID=UPI001C071785|nr:peptidoglycan DD-metalloendopeptidase family protein [Winogradskyella psychrotolerans]MBU2928595.1 peptidoglycan DD-metalloendopeptidase family protein [Winogradskyella psychrotolerans]
MTILDLLTQLEAHPLVDPSIPKASYMPLDLSVDNSELQAVNVSDAEDLERYIWRYMIANKAKIAYGGYLEKRGIYQRSTYFNQTNPETERNIHLGLDLWIEADTPIFAPLAGTIHSFKNNTNHGDYGPTIILKHHSEGGEFYTLYGHLSIASIEDLEVGVEVTQGAQIGTLGMAKVNGDYPPHLHFQIIHDIQDFSGDYPGVSNQLDLAFYKNNCPDPNLLLKLY